MYHFSNNIPHLLPCLVVQPGYRGKKPSINGLMARIRCLLTLRMNLLPLTFCPENKWQVTLKAYSVFKSSLLPGSHPKMCTCKRKVLLTGVLANLNNSILCGDARVVNKPWPGRTEGSWFDSRQGHEFLCPPKRADRLWANSAFYSMSTGLFPRGEADRS